MNLNEAPKFGRQDPTKGEPSASLTPAQARNYRDALLALGVDEQAAQRNTDRVVQQPRAHTKAVVKEAVKFVFKRGNGGTVFAKNS